MHTLCVVDASYRISRGLDSKATDFGPVVTRIREAKNRGDYGVVALHLAYTGGINVSDSQRAAMCALATIAQTMAVTNLHNCLTLSDFTSAQIILDHKEYPQTSVGGLVNVIKTLLASGAVPIVSNRADVFPRKCSSQSFGKVTLFTTPFLEELALSAEWRVFHA